jgi:asparagine synthase (glutamine-hydrolysing)
VPYTRARWRAVWRDSDFESYLAHAHGLTSVPNLQAVPALFELRRSGWIEPDAVFVPALAGFFPGGCLPSLATVERIVSDISVADFDSLVEVLMKRHFRTSNLRRIAPAVRERFVGQLRALRASHRALAEANPSERVIWLSEAFEYHERQAKFIGTACRYFDSFGYDWWLPMWDTEFVDVCESLPLNCRRDKSLLKMVTHRFERRYPQMVGPPPPFIVNGGFVRNQRLRALTSYFLDPFGQFAVVPFVDWLARVYGRSPSGGTVVDVLSQRCLQALAPTLGRSTA